MVPSSFWGGIDCGSGRQLLCGLRALHLTQVSIHFAVTALACHRPLSCLLKVNPPPLNDEEEDSYWMVVRKYKDLQCILYTLKTGCQFF